MSFAIGGPTARWAQVSSKSANYAITDTDELGVILGTTGSSNNLEITLPAPGNNQDRIIEVIKVDSGTKFIEIKQNASENIRGVASSIYAIQQFESIKLLSDGTNWVLLGEPYRTVSAYIDNDGTPTVTFSSGEWISSVTSSATGRLAINFVTGVFSSIPSTTAINVTTGGSMIHERTAATTSAVEYNSVSNGGSSTNYPVKCILHGAK